MSGALRWTERIPVVFAAVCLTSVCGAWKNASRRLIDTRVQTIHVARQQVITKHNVPVGVDAVLFFKVKSAADAVMRVQDSRFAISQYARTSLRDVLGQ
jgi:regulator of protease activity HflC (stomatin/prohibitin superfamily)